MKLQEHIIILKTKKYPKLIVEKGIEKGLAVPWEQLSSEKWKTTIFHHSYLFTSTYNPNNYKDRDKDKDKDNPNIYKNKDEV